jgi:hypothetical protein
LFLSFHIFQEARSAISMKRGLFHLVLPSSRIFNLSPCKAQLIGMLCEQLVLKGQWNNKCLMVSSGGLVHIKQEYPEFSVNFLLLNIFLVFNLSVRTSQPKNFTLGVHLDFHSHLNAAWAVIFWKQKL